MITITRDDEKINQISIMLEPTKMCDANLSNAFLYKMFLSDCQIANKMFDDLGINKDSDRVKVNAKNSRKQKKSPYIIVNDEILLYQLSDAGLLNKLHGMRHLNEGYIYYFDKDPDVQKIVDKYMQEKGSSGEINLDESEKLEPSNKNE